MQPLRSSREAPEAEREAIAETPLLIHSIGQFGEVSRRPLEIVAPRRIVEIGGEEGGFTAAMAEWAHRAGAEMITIDPAPSAVLRELSERYDEHTLVDGFSPAALEGLEPADLYVVDGDHNYAVVKEEVERILTVTADAAHPALVMLHDVAWPCARRDFYYGPRQLEPEDLHPHSFGAGLTATEVEPREGKGFRGSGDFAIAIESGGERNGVLTAVEDAIESREGLELHIIPAIFGLGFLFPSDAPWAGELRELLTPLESSELLALLERNRLALYMHVLELQDELARYTA